MKAQSAHRFEIPHLNVLSDPSSSPWPARSIPERDNSARRDDTAGPISPLWHWEFRPIGRSSVDFGGVWPGKTPSWSSLEAFGVSKLRGHAPKTLGSLRVSPGRCFRGSRTAKDESSSAGRKSGSGFEPQWTPSPSSTKLTVGQPAPQSTRMASEADLRYGHHGRVARAREARIESHDLGDR